MVSVVSFKMAVSRLRRSLAFELIILFVDCVCAQYKIPNVNIQAFKPKGFRASIEDAPNLGLFAFHGNINHNIGANDVGTIAGEVTAPADGRWVVDDPNLQLKMGDVISYYVFVSVSGKGYIKDNLTYVVTELLDPSTPLAPGPAECRPTVTTVIGATACAGQTVFEDNFENLRENVWQIEQYIPINHPEYPFVSYQRLAEQPTVAAKDGYLTIGAKPQQNLRGFNNESVYSATLDLFSGCTASAEACFVQASGADIIPPVVAGRVTSKSFAFKYGTVSVRAKLPQGDWLYPEILLEPFRKKYGSQQYTSGVLKIATARGNGELSSGSTDYSSKVLYGGPIMDFQCRETLVTKRQMTNGQWNDDFHVYSVRWAPERITLSVDGEEWARVEPAASGLAGRFPADCDKLPRQLLNLGSKMAPFDEHFYITLGLAAGGVTEFPDGASGGGRPKPWSNRGRKAALHFWQDLDAWLPTWRRPELQVDYVRVVAL